MFGKKSDRKKSKKAKTEELEINPQIAEQTHVMPPRFYIVPKRKRTGLIVIIVIGILLIATLSVAGYFLIENFSKNQPGPANININQPVTNESVNQNFEPPVNENVNTNLNQNLNVNTNVSTTTDVNANVNVNTNENINTNTSTSTPTEPLKSSADIDGDNLTTAEEALFGTNPEVNDSDSDGYMDGSELISGYDPTRPAVTLADSGLIRTYNSSEYSIIYPSVWQVRELGEEIIFQAQSGEFVEVLMILNPNNLALLNWYQEQFPAISLDSVTQVRINNLSGIRSADQATYYLVNPDNLSRIYLITYNTGSLEEANFITTFNVMVKNFRLLP
ncbi:MAG: hypothetical protein A2731_02185 [Candidatus Buchananbacteria bacterium RIFCSPHIGHO2_01_FULL_39_8]|uniref:EF-hand domain-containing protein n=1 Tax=Candidatus Buchananbacteria bacterium RIFCSPHIGHO2_01_FULL_39_8 TaxID=1797533 RepID=A0A1G1Y177_9BACT|nr:MAG: hypothetical protein A2731_02185 [Candidatus Buchananbacteria bacterium RIFCSPHIGHO2_01_FULL_39_8]